jgi:hypothetical protein
MNMNQQQQQQMNFGSLPKPPSQPSLFDQAIEEFTKVAREGDVVTDPKGRKYQWVALPTLSTK